MKRAGNLYERIVEPENLRLAFIKSIRSKRGKADVIAYTANLDVNLPLHVNEAIQYRTLDRQFWV